MSESLILYENADLFVLRKPAGLETVSQSGEKDFLALARETLKAMKTPGEQELAPAHRLDRDTSGAQLVARTADAEKKLAALFRQRAVEKMYCALCLGAPRNAAGSINRRLSEWGGGHRPVKVLKQGGLEASTEYRVVAVSEWLAEDFRASLIAFFPHQGRTHQIRVHAAALGYPVLGDDQYGDRAANKTAKQMLGVRRQALHSARLRFDWNGAVVDAFCPLAEDMRNAVETLWPGKNLFRDEKFPAPRNFNQQNIATRKSAVAQRDFNVSPGAPRGRGEKRGKR